MEQWIGLYFPWTFCSFLGSKVFIVRAIKVEKAASWYIVNRAQLKSGHYFNVIENQSLVNLDPFFNDIFVWRTTCCRHWYQICYQHVTYTFKCDFHKIRAISIPAFQCRTQQINYSRVLLDKILVPGTNCQELLCPVHESLGGKVRDFQSSGWYAWGIMLIFVSIDQLMFN